MKLKRGVGGLKCVLGEFHILISSETDKSCIYNPHPHIPDSSHWQGVWILILHPIRHNWKIKCYNLKFFLTQIKILSSQKHKTKWNHHLCPQSTSGTKNPNLLRLCNLEMVEMWKSTILSNRCLSHSNLSSYFFLLFIIILYSKDEKCHKNLS